LNQRLLESELSLELHPEVMDKITDLGFNPVYGARPLKRAIQKWIENPLSQEIIKGAYESGDTIIADIREGKIVFSQGKSALN